MGGVSGSEIFLTMGFERGIFSSKSAKGLMDMTMEGPFKLVMRLTRLADILIKTIIIASMLAILVVTCLQVFMRFIMGNPLPWPEELARYAMIWASLLAAVYVQLDRGHLGIDFFVLKLPKKAAIVVRILMNVLIIVFMIAAISSGINEAYTLMGMKTGALQISRGIPYLAVPVSCSLFVIVTLVLIFKDFTEFKQK